MSQNNLNRSASVKKQKTNYSPKDSSLSFQSIISKDAESNQNFILGQEFNINNINERKINCLIVNDDEF